MITIFWRGTGIIIPILLGLSFWITSYWFEDTRLGNLSYVGWSVLWPAIIITLLGITDFIKNEPDENGEVAPKQKNDLFWIPVFVWGVCLLGLSIYFIFKGPSEGYGDHQNTTVISDEEKEDAIDNQAVQKEEIEINFYNAQEDTAFLELTRPDDDAYELNVSVPPNAIKFGDFKIGKYEVHINGEVRSLDVKPFKGINADTKYNSAWYVLRNNIDFVLVDVSAACRSDINETELMEINWSEKVLDTYSGGGLIQIILNHTDAKSEYVVYDPGTDLPLELKENQIVYSIIPFERTKGYSEEFLDAAIIDLCY